MPYEFVDGAYGEGDLVPGHRALAETAVYDYIS